MENLKKIYHENFYVIVIVWLIIFAAAVYWIGSAYETRQFDKTVDSQRTDANKAVSEAANALRQAANTSIERRTEDAIREKVIQPKLGDVRRRSQISKAELDAARNNFNAKKNDTSNLSNSDADNCVRLKQLFPNVNFADCR